jgi:hypothetical protein
VKKIWAKVIINFKVKKSILFEAKEEITTSNFYGFVIEVCNALKLPTPLITPIQTNNFLEFNILKLKQRDFIEEIAFDILQFELCE